MMNLYYIPQLPVIKAYTGCAFVCFFVYSRYIFASYH